MGKKDSPAPENHQGAQASYDRLSRWYDRLAGSEWRSTEQGLRALDVHPGERVLEIGPGPGRALQALAEAVGVKGQAWGIDLSAGMLREARGRFARAGLAGRVNLIQGDGVRLPTAAGAFDAVFLAFTLELFDSSEIPLVLDECKRVLHHGGRIGVVSLVKKDRANLAVRLYEWARRRWPSLIDCRPIQVRPALEAAGFHVIGETIRGMWGLPVAIVVARA